MIGFLNTIRVLLKDFKGYAQGVTNGIRQTTTAIAEEQGRRKEYLYSSGIRKERRAREIAEQDNIKSGLICVLDCVEPCWSYHIDKNRDKKRLELRLGYSKCLHHYFYFLDPRWGFMHVRLQTWFPLTIHVCINGREWRARQMNARRMKYVRRENCFTHITNLPRAQALMNDQLQTNWPHCLNRLEQTVNPARRRLLPLPQLEYYWSVESSEWAADVMFRSPAALAALYPDLIRHGIQTFSSKDVMRFLGRKTPASTNRYGKFSGEVVSDLGTRVEGLRIKHRVNKNSIKMYDKQGSVLRVETTINNADEFKVYRPVEGDPQGECDWRRMRRGVADLHRRTQVSQAANERYLAALEPVDQSTPLGKLAGQVTCPVIWQGRPVRGLRPLSADDMKLLSAVSHGEFTINGFRNRDLREILFAASDSKDERRRQSGKVTRMLRMLRAHRLIRKVSGTHRYVLTDRGRSILTALIQASKADTEKLKKLAA
ncbi:MAG: hypothetical protein IH831_04275 [Planctomycetes bacterium]|nr:hypothetical protein [Planctomycetota bacterium]